MRAFFGNMAYYLIYGGIYLISLLPLRCLYFFADCLRLLLYYLVRYRRRVVRNNLVSSFPEKTLEEIIRIEREYYAFFCDYMVETVKLCSIGESEMKRRMVFENSEAINDVLRSGRSVSLYLGHYCNWEWVSSLPASLQAGSLCGQIYHPLESRLADRLFLTIRGRFGALSIAQDDTFRTVMTWQKEKRPNVVGYIADQVPGYGSAHYWADFLHHDTPAFTGAERIARLNNSTVFYADMTRVRRGYYTCRFVEITSNPQSEPRFAITAVYFRLLEESIRRCPPYWLWSHKRWKRTREEFNRLFSEEERKRILSKL